MEDSNHLLGDPEALRNEFEKKGFLLIRGVHDRDQVLAARMKVGQSGFSMHACNGELDQASLTAEC